MRHFLILTALVVLAGCSPNRPIEPAVNHIVFFKLKSAADAPALIADCDARLRPIPGAVAYYAGTHLDIGRPNIDSDYDVGFYIAFDTVDAYRAYLDHPDHVHLVNKWRDRWEWIRIYDVQHTKR